MATRILTQTNKNARFSPKNQQKYVGDISKIVPRSSWETLYMNLLDQSAMVAKWTSEPKTLNIKYLSPLDNKPHSYWPDFIVWYVNGTIEIVEIKPLKESVAEAARTTYDKLSLIKNIAKWTAADAFAKSIGARFRVVTEKQLFSKKPAKAPKRSKATKR
jgi:hypothetical protein